MRFATVVAAALTAAGPVCAMPRPPGLTPAPASAEAGFWDLSARAERTAQHNADLNPDPALTAYVRDVACKVTAEYCKDVRVYVLDRPFFNATMAPNGFTEVWSGLLLRCDDEELAFVLGHEASHFAESHSIVAYNAQKSRANTALALSIVIAAAGTVAAAGAGTPQDAQSIIDATGNLVDAVYLASIASFFRFSREQESEADMLGLKRSAAAGYRPGAAVEVWRDLRAETSTSDFERVRKADTRLGIFDSHPLSSARVDALAAAAKTMPDGSRGALNRHRAAIRPFLSVWLRDDLRRRDFGETLHIVDRMSQTGQDLGVLGFYRGEAYRLRGKDGDRERAAAAYAKASTEPDAPVAVWRELGDMRLRTGDAAGARSALETYLTRAPEAEDAWMVRETLSSLGKAG
jgi:predicted Zn-dependent protease